MVTKRPDAVALDLLAGGRFYFRFEDRAAKRESHMATDTAVALPTSAPFDHTRHAWQIPVLLLGVAAFVCVWKGWVPIPRSDPPALFAQDVGKLKSAYEKATPDVSELKNLLIKVASGVEQYPDQAPLARFHLGSGYARLAELTPALDEAHGYWTLARQHFELVNEKQLRDQTDRARLIFRSTKARVAVGLPAETSAAEIAVLISILSTPQPGEEAGETYRLIADLALRTNPPNIAGAKVALTQYLTATGIATPAASLARAKLRLGDLYLHTKDYEQARKWLREIGNDTPPDTLVPAKVLLARVLMAESNWLDAAKELELLRGLPGVPPSFRLGAAYQLGVCKLKLREPDAAARLFEEAAKGESAEATAAAIQLADLHLRAADAVRHKAAVELLAAAVKGISKPAEYDPSYIPLNEAQAVFELAATKLLADREYEAALRVTESYAALAAPGRDREKRAEVFGAWGDAMLKAKTGDPKPLFKKAADEFAALAAFQPKTDGKLDLLRRAAAYSRQANDPNAAAARLVEAVKLPNIPEQVQPAVWLELADALLAANRPEEVFKIFNRIMASDSPLSTAVRYRLARVFVDSRDPRLVPTGRALFEQIAKQQHITREEREYHERSLTELANALIRDGNFTDAEARLRTQLGIYSNGPEAPLARLLLGVCLLQRAAAPNTQAADAAKMRTEAITNFKQIVTECDAIERRVGKLNDREAWLRLQAALRVLQTHQQIRTPQSARDLLAEASSLLERHKGTVEELIILSLVYHAFKQLNESGLALSTRDRMRDVFEKLPPTAFPQKTGEYSRDYWLKVWFPPESKER